MLDFVLTPDTIEALTELVDGEFAKHRAFIGGEFDVAEREPCTVQVVHPEGGEPLVLRAEVVYVGRSGPGAGVGVQLLDTDGEALRAFAARRGAPAGVRGSERAPAQPRTVHERVRTLGIADQQRLARSGSLAERVALERACGPAVWDALLGNPQITAPEVSRIAKMGALPKPLVSVIVGNAAWLKIGEIQRALLSNPRVTGGELSRVMRALSPADLQRIAKGAYRSQVKAEARQLLGKR